jgi:alpha-beta hydrolase superfamily lysophospholipase
MCSFHLVNIWVNPEAGPGGFNPMEASMLWLPDDHRTGHPAPAFVFVPGWDGYPHDPVPSVLGPELADEGFGFLSICLRRRGVGQLMSMPDDDLRDIKLAVDYLQTNGFSKIFLLGEGVGGNSVIRYQAKHRDGRVAGVSWLNPIDDPADWLGNAVGAEAYGAEVRMAGLAARQGAAMTHRVDLLPPGVPAITQYAGPFLSWWGPKAGTRLARSFEDLLTPMLVCAAGGRNVPDALAAVIAASEQHRALQLSDADPLPGGLANELVNWSTGLGADRMADTAPEMVQVKSAGESLFGLIWLPADGGELKTATLLMHGLSSSPLSPLFGKLAPVLAQTGTAVLAVESRRSCWAGHETALMEYDAEDLDVWVKFLLARGYEKIILAGASLGSVSIGRYQSLHQHPNVVGLAHLMPTADCPEWFRAGAGEGSYADAVAKARAAIADGLGDRVLIDIDIRQPAPNPYHGVFRWTQRAASWLSWWGPDADSRNTAHIANARVPVLLLSGSDDSYNDEARFAELKAAAVNAPRVDEIWYPDIDHGLAGVETQVARDLYAWMQKIGVVG